MEILEQPALRNPIAVSLGAIAGALCRYYLSAWFVERFGIVVPYGTFFVNITGSLAMGFFITLSSEKMTKISPEIRLLVAVGFLGSYTTFSSYELDAIALLKRHNFLGAIVYWAGSAILGAIGLYLGVILARSGK